MNIKIDYSQKVGSGSASDVYKLNDAEVVVVGKRDDCYANFKSLFEKYKAIEGKISSVDYPKISKIIAPCTEFPYGAMIENYIDGGELKKVISTLTDKQKKKIGNLVGKFINEMHSIQMAGDKAGEIAINMQKFDRSANMLKSYLSQDYMDKIGIVRQKYFDFMTKSTFCTTHGDLNAGNILIKDGELAGIIDFGNMEYYVPEVEFAHMYFFDKTIYDSMVASCKDKIADEDVILVELVMSIRHFKNIVNFDHKVNECLQKITSIMDIALTRTPVGTKL